MFILGGFAISSGLLTIAFLPETLGAGLPEVTTSNSINVENLNEIKGLSFSILFGLNFFQLQDLEDIASLKTNSKSMWTCVKPKKRS